MTLTEFCVCSLRGEGEKKRIPYDPSIGVVSPQKKRDALADGFLVLGPFSDGTVSIFNQNFSQEDNVVKSVEPEVEDPNDPFSGYYPPPVVDDILLILESPKTSNLWLFGPSQCGKTVGVEYIGHKLDRKIYSINCVGDMPSSFFFGRNTVVIDPVTKQNHIVHVKGIVEESMTHGLDDKGEVIGPPSILFIDEAAAMSPMVGIGLNRTLQTNSNVRELILPDDGNRVVKSHPGWRVILAGNTNGNGANSMGSQIYTAQRRAMDASLMERMTMTFRFGYDRKAEAKIAKKSLESSICNRFLEFKQAIRDAIGSDLTTPFSTKRIIDICDLCKIYRPTMSGEMSLAKAIYYTTFEKLMDEEKPKYNELFHPLFNINLSDFAPNDDADFL